MGSILRLPLNGLSHKLGFHFEPSSSDFLKRLEFFRESYPDYQDSFNEFQKHFENKFGYPTKTYPKNEEGFPSYEWLVGKNIIISHYIFDRFGLEERLQIKRI